MELNGLRKNPMQWAARPLNIQKWVKKVEGRLRLKKVKPTGELKTIDELKEDYHVAVWRRAILNTIEQFQKTHGSLTAINRVKIKKFYRGVEDAMIRIQRDKTEIVDYDKFIEFVIDGLTPILNNRHEAIEFNLLFWKLEEKNLESFARERKS